MAQNNRAENGVFSYSRTGNMGRHGLPKIQTQHEKTASEVCHDDSITPVKAKTIDKLHSLQKKKSQPTMPITGSQGALPPPCLKRIATSSSSSPSECNVGVCDSASLASLTRETGPKLVKGDPARKSDGQKATHVEHHLYDASLFGVSDSALKFTHILYNLSRAELYEQAIKYEKGSFVTASGALATLSGQKVAVLQETNELSKMKKLKTSFGGERAQPTLKWTSILS